MTTVDEILDACDRVAPALDAAARQDEVERLNHRS
jgi:hypothetical protein